MLALVMGGSASGKSAWAEGLAVSLGERRLYIATMQPFDGECRRRIARHRDMRREKRFETLEVYTGLKNVKLEQPADVVLLECLSNLLANEMYGPEGCGEGFPDRILEGIFRLAEQTPHLVIVSNEVFSDGDSYSEETLEYMAALGYLNRRIAARADLAAELAAGLPVLHKGGNLL